jgi:hypothetical protein
MERSIKTVTLEALVIGGTNALLFWLLNLIGLKINKLLILVLVGALIHVIFEYTGANKWWCKTTYN